MKLIAIHLHGFKSFAHASHFPLESALTGIVGPNGCGKSNIIDAVRWVLGENAAKQLRGQTANDVIFAGANDRRPASQVTVELVFEQGEQRLDAFAEMDTISVSRRMNRNGQSVYQINQKVVRRRDVVSLLHLMGVSARSYAVIEQGMIGRIIDAKPEELRGFIEEAAGIAIYKDRRKETEQRLNEVAQHLLRHDERLQDLTRRKDKLADEAAVAKRFQELNQQQNSLSHRLRSFQYHQLQLSLLQAQQEQNESRQQLQDLEQSDSLQRLLAQQEALQEAKEALHEAKQEHLSALQQQQQHQKQWEQQRFRQDLNAQQLQELETLIEDLNQEQEAGSASLMDLEASILQLEQGIHSFSPQLLRLQQQQQQAQQKQEQQRLQQQEQQQQRQQYQQQQQRLQQECQRLQNQMQQWQQRCQQHELALNEALPESSDEEALYQQIQEELLVFEEDLYQRQSEVERLQQQWQQAQQQAQQLQQQEEHVRGQLAVLSASLPEPNPAWAHLPQVMSQLDIAAPWQSALERHLGAVLMEAHSRQHEDWRQALQQGRSLLGHAAVPEAWRDIVRSEVDLTALLKHLIPLAQHDSDIQLEALQPGQHYLSLDGSICSRDSVLVNQAQAGQLAQWQRYQNILNDLPQLEATRHEALQQSEQARQQWQDAQQQYQQAQQQQRQKQQALQQAQQQYQLQQQARQHQALLREQHRQQLELLQYDTQQAELQYQEHQEALLVLEEQLLMLSITPTFELEDDWLQRAQSAYREAEQQQQERQRQLVRLQTQRESLQQQAQRLQMEYHKQQQKKEQWQQEALQLTQLMQQSEWQLEHDAQQVEALQDALQEQEWQYEQARQQCHEAERLLDNVQQQQKLLQERLQLQQAQIEQLQQQKGVYEVEFQEMAWEALDFAADEVVDTQALHAEIRGLKQALQSLGAVNLAAIADFDTISEEHQHWQAQCDDLRQSVQMLQEAIEQLDNETKKRLSETFDALNEAFAEHIARLFNGGKGSLSWNSPDILQAGIVIHVALMGKKLRHLGALSGGEKALSALSLVFALFRQQPAPFCLLDEVDAPLDAANVQRLCALLQEMSQRTQLVVITHHQQTMRHCQRLVGVTMSEPGVSRLVGVDLRV